MIAEAESFWDRVAAGYAKRPISDMDAYDRTLERTRTYLKSDDSVLETGCGTGTTALRLAPHVKSITASDISANMIGIARGKAEAEGTDNAHFIQWNLSKDGAPENVYDAAIAFNLFHLLDDAPAALEQIRERLKPGGLLISKTVCLSEGGFLVRLVLPVMQAFGRAPYVRFFRIAELEAMIADAGFRIVETGNYPAKPPSRFVVAQKL